MAQSTSTINGDADGGIPLDDLPPGDHALEVAARSGFGPLSPLVRATWHGDSVPCVTCGQLVRRAAPTCDHCGQDLGPAMVAKMRLHAGPWFVLEHVRPFPGVSLDRIVRQIHRGLITETSILRGPATDHQWRFAVEIPGICRYFGRCWRCHGTVGPADSSCPGCLAKLAPAHQGAPVSGAPPNAEGAGQSPLRSVDHSSTRPAGPARSGGGGFPPDPPERGTTSMIPPGPVDRLKNLSVAVCAVGLPETDRGSLSRIRFIGVPVGWIAAVIVLGAILTIVGLSIARSPTPEVPISGEPVLEGSAASTPFP